MLTRPVFVTVGSGSPAGPSSPLLPSVLVLEDPQRSIRDQRQQSGRSGRDDPERSVPGTAGKDDPLHDPSSGSLSRLSTGLSRRVLRRSEAMPPSLLPRPRLRQSTGQLSVALYLVSKILYIANIVGQLCLLNVFLGADFHLYGIQVSPLK